MIEDENANSADVSNNFRIITGGFDQDDAEARRISHGLRAKELKGTVRLKLDSESELSFASGQNLGCLSKRLSDNAVLLPHCSRIFPIKHVEKLK